MTVTAAASTPVAGDTKRAYLVRLGLAKDGARGRFSKDGIAALAAVEGFVFADATPAKAAPKAPKAPGAVSAGTSRAARNVAALSGVKAATVIGERAPSPMDMPKRRSETVGWVVERNALIAFTSCSVKGGCGKPVSRCVCATGPKAPHYLDAGVAGTPLLLVKPVV